MIYIHFQEMCQLMILHNKRIFKKSIHSSSLSFINIWTKSKTINFLNIESLNLQMITSQNIGKHWKSWCWSLQLFRALYNIDTYCMESIHTCFVFMWSKCSFNRVIVSWKQYGRCVWNKQFTLKKYPHKSIWQFSQFQIKILRCSLERLRWV